jgi:hypothetical protein
MKRIKRVSLWTTAVVITAVVSSLVAFAGQFRSPSKDIYCLVPGAGGGGNVCYDGYGIQTNGTGIGVCNSTMVGYIGWDLGGVATEIRSAKLTLTATSVTGAPANPPSPLTFSLLVPGNHTWTEPTSPSGGGTDPGVGAVIATGTATLSDGTASQSVTFGGPGDTVAADALGDYFEDLRSGIDPANSTIAVRISGGCTASSLVRFAERGSAGEADLVFYPQDGATAVTLSTFASADPMPNRPLIAGLAALAAIIVAGGVVIYRKRAAVRA